MYQSISVVLYSLALFLVYYFLSLLMVNELSLNLVDRIIPPVDPGDTFVTLSLNTKPIQYEVFTLPKHSTRRLRSSMIYHGFKANIYTFVNEAREHAKIESERRDQIQKAKFDAYMKSLHKKSKKNNLRRIKKNNIAKKKNIVKKATPVNLNKSPKLVPTAVVPKTTPSPPKLEKHDFIKQLIPTAEIPIGDSLAWEEDGSILEDKKMREKAKNCGLENGKSYTACLSELRKVAAMKREIARLKKNLGVGDSKNVTSSKNDIKRKKPIRSTKNLPPTVAEIRARQRESDMIKQKERKRKWLLDERKKMLKKKAITDKKLKHARAIERERRKKYIAEEKAFINYKLNDHFDCKTSQLKRKSYTEIFSSTEKRLEAKQESCLEKQEKLHCIGGVPKLASSQCPTTKAKCDKEMKSLKKELLKWRNKVADEMRLYGSHWCKMSKKSRRTLYKLEETHEQHRIQKLRKAYIKAETAVAKIRGETLKKEDWRQRYHREDN